MSAIAIEAAASPLAARGELTWGIRALSLPLTSYTGDFFFSTTIGDTLWAAVGDFAGHGLNATVFMSMIQEELDRLIRSAPRSNPADVIAALDESLRELLPFNRFVTLVLLRACEGGELELVNAGHPSPLLRRADGSMERLPSNGPVVGIAPRPRWDSQQVILGRGDDLFIVTDGVLEAGEADDRPFGMERLSAQLAAWCYEQPLERLLDDVQQFAGRFDDDVTLFALSRREHAQGARTSQGAKNDRPSPRFAGRGIRGRGADQSAESLKP